MSSKVIQEKKKFLSKYKSVKLYKKILDGKVDGFPEQYWEKCTDREKEGAMCVRYMAEVVLKIDNEGYKKISKRHIKEYKLEGMLVEVFDGNVFNVVNYIHPGKFYEWYYLGRTKGYWSKERLVWAVRYIFKQNDWDYEDIKENYNYKFIIENGLEYALKKFYDNKIYDLLQDVLEEVSFREWEMKNVSKSYWTKETAIISTIWMISKLKWSREDIRTKINKGTFKDMGLAGMLKQIYNNSVYDAINAAYPGEYKRYEFSVSKGYWTKETLVSAIKDMIDDLGYERNDIRDKLSKEDFDKYKLNYPVQKIFEGSYYDSINATYPGEYKKYELKNFKYKEVRMNKIAEYISLFEY